MRYLQMGLEEKLKGNLEPWLCYYCGECSDECPRDAEPGETMMSLRRWLTSQYDFTGISKLFYRSWKIEIAAILLVAALTGLGFWLFGNTRGEPGRVRRAGGLLPELGDPQVRLGAGLPAGRPAPDQLRADVVVQHRARSASSGSRSRPTSGGSSCCRSTFSPRTATGSATKKRPWAIHLALMLSYLTMLVLIMFFLHQVQSGPGDRLARPRLRLPGDGRAAGHDRLRPVRPHPEIGDALQALPRIGLDFPDPAGLRGRHRDCAARAPSGGPEHRGQHRPTSPT